MTQEKKVLFISNGYGEDTIAASVIKYLAELMPLDKILGFPLVGEGSAYKSIGINVAAPVQDMPSGGLIPGGWVKNLLKDFSAGLGQLIIQQTAKLRDLKKEVSLVAAVGDAYPVILGGMFAAKPVIFIGTAKSDYFYPYSAMEKTVFKRYCTIIYPRDEITAESLRNSGINAQWVGNAMMDSLAYTGDRFNIPEDTRIITLLPGSRDFAYNDFPVILKAAEIIHKNLEDKPAFTAALADSIDLHRLGESAARVSFSLAHYDNKEGVIGKYSRNAVEVSALRNRFADAIKNACLVIGQAGTGNEQAVGLGKPVISFDSEGKEKLGWYRLRQKGLLGDSILITPRDSEEIAQAALSLLQNKDKYEAMASIGRERMGPPGGAKKMAEGIFAHLV